MPGFPRARAGLGTMKFLRIHADMVGHEPQREFAQRGEVRFAEKFLRSTRGAFRQINFSLLQTGDQFGRRQIHQLNLRGVENAVGNGFPDFCPGDLAYGVGATFDVLDIQCRENINSSVEQFVHILPAFRMARTRCVRVCKFVHERKLWMP